MAPVFIALLFAILETALMFFASQVLETVTQDSAREAGVAENYRLEGERQPEGDDGQGHTSCSHTR